LSGGVRSVSTSDESFLWRGVDCIYTWLARRDDRANGQGSTAPAICILPEVAFMSVLMMSMAVNLAVVVLFFAAAVLMTVGMLGMH
jgi:hypothetical protein